MLNFKGLDVVTDLLGGTGGLPLIGNLTGGLGGLGNLTGGLGGLGDLLGGGSSGLPFLNNLPISNLSQATTLLNTIPSLLGNRIINLNFGF